MKIVSWNVNGLARCRRNGFLKFLADAKPDILCCQEIKGRCALNTPGYLQFWNLAKRPNFSGTLILSKRQPLSSKIGIGIEKFDEEGRVVALEYKNFFIIDIYVPSLHPHSPPERYDYRREWDKALKDYVTSLPKPAILCGDFNVTREWIDIYPENQKNSPDQPLFLSEERAGFEELISAGYVDTFRAFYPKKDGAYTWWGPRKNSREENRGSRLDYILVSGELLSYVQSIKHHTDTLGSDHCPVSIITSAIARPHNFTEEELAVKWRTIDWGQMEKELFRKQNRLAYAAYSRDWDKVKVLQNEIVNSYVAKVMAVRYVADSDSAAGVDGVKLTSDAQKMMMALSLTARGYRPLPNRYEVAHERGRELILHIPAARDKAMLVLYSYGLDPIAESTADKMSFFSRKGRSQHDALAYVLTALGGKDPPKYVVRADVKTFYNTVLHSWLIENIPMDKTVLTKFLRAGVVKNRELFETTRGISFASSLSPILGNMMLDGLQSYIYDHLYPQGNVDYANGSTVRFADDLVITARTKECAEKIMEIVGAFLAARGLSFNQEKTYIAHVGEGFTFLSWRIRERNGVIEVEPADKAVISFEYELEDFIRSFNGTLRVFITRLNDRLSGWAKYHHTVDAYYVFRHIDVVVEGFLLDRMYRKYPRWHRETVKKKFWVLEDGYPVFAHPDEPSLRVIRLAPTAIAMHKPCKAGFNPYLDRKYMSILQHRRDEQKANGKYRRVWQRQAGKCAFCGNPMLADQEVEVIEKVIGKGRRVQNLIYIHRQCAYDVYSDSDDEDRDHVDLLGLLENYVCTTQERESPYLELRDYFRMSDKSPISLTFQKIEEILGDRLPAEAYLYDAFWFESLPGMPSPLWREEGYPFHAIVADDIDYCISNAWSSQGYEIKALHRESERVVFRRVVAGVSGLKIPKALTDRKLPDHLIYKIEKMLTQFVRDYGL